MSRFPEGLEPQDDLTPATWVEEALKNWPRGRPFQVRDLVPPVFEAYARILHHAWRPGDVREPSGRWIDPARRRGVGLGPETRWDELAFPFERPWALGPDGTISESELFSLARMIGRVAPSPSSCWFALWSGFGFLKRESRSSYLRVGRSLRQRVAVARIRMKERIEHRFARMTMPRYETFPLLDGGRSYLLIRGVLDDAVRLHREWQFHPPTLWWSEDRAWFVHTEIDATSTYVGGPRALIDGLLDDQSLEAFEVGPDTLAAL